MVGLLLKQLMFMRSASSSQVYFSVSFSRISASFTPCKGLFGWVFGVLFSDSIGVGGIVFLVSNHDYILQIRYCSAGVI